MPRTGSKSGRSYIARHCSIPLPSICLIPAMARPPCYNLIVNDQPAIVLYTRPGCHLCEDESADLLPLAQQYGLDVKTVNIMDDSEAHDRWWAEIPVIMIGSTVLTAPID